MSAITATVRRDRWDRPAPLADDDGSWGPSCGNCSFSVVISASRPGSSRARPRSMSPRARQPKIKGDMP
ncbi:hypothetical protein [Streptomyces tanashiensis]|uniref:hypothetical protein n=1 Tax=Streptomyces tanashiensis TaxID=67367 RepID=UPI001E4A58F6|nr:hypothetical protein [Streptomyces tanashiensis]